MNPGSLLTKNDSDLVHDPANVDDADQIHVLDLDLEALADDGEDDRAHDRALVPEIVIIDRDDTQLAHVHDHEGDRAQDLKDDHDRDLEDGIELQGRSQGRNPFGVSVQSQRRGLQKRKAKIQIKLKLIFDAALQSLTKLKNKKKTRPWRTS
jgi:hypothetical protein